MENKKKSGLSPITKEWLKSLHQTPVIKKNHNKGTELWREAHSRIDQMEVRRPRSQCSMAHAPVERGGCICDRPKTMVHCHRCNFRHFGRTQQVCPAHPRTSFLMDLSLCPNCLAANTMKEEKAQDST